MNNDYASLIREACDGWHVQLPGADPAGTEYIFASHNEAIAFLTENHPTGSSPTSSVTPPQADLVTPEENKIT